MSEHFFPTNKNHKQSYEEKSKEMEIIPTWGDKDTLWSLLKLTIYLNLHIFIPFIIIISKPTTSTSIPLLWKEEVPIGYIYSILSQLELFI
jgi:hypothetical protein